MAKSHDGMFCDDTIYTTHAVARIMGWEQTRTAEQWLQRIGCSMKPAGTRRLVSGYEMRLAIERYEPEGEETDLDS